MGAEAALPLPETVGQRVRYVRDFVKGWTQTELARHTELVGFPIPKHRIMRIEQGMRPRLIELAVLALVLDVSMAQLGATERDFPELRAARSIAEVLDRIRWNGKRPRHLRLVGPREP